MHHDESSKPVGQPYYDKTIFGFGMKWIRDGGGVRITKNRAGFLKRNAVFFNVGSGFGNVPFKPHIQAFFLPAIDGLYPLDEKGRKIFTIFELQAACCRAFARLLRWRERNWSSGTTVYSPSV